jgi:HSP20 family protein
MKRREKMLTRWPNFAEFPTELNRLRDAMERVFEGLGRGPQVVGSGAYPLLNLWEDNDNLFVEAELPGMELNELEIYVNGGDQLTIQGQRRQPNGDTGTWHRQERGYGKFSRMVRLPSQVDAEHVNARFSDGVLTITLPKREEDKPRRIEIKAS